MTAAPARREAWLPDAGAAANHVVTASRGSRPGPGLPRYVRACSNNPARDKPRWALAMWSKGSPESATMTPYRCGSWRCKVCERWRSSVDFARITEAFDGVPSNEMVFLVLTLDQNGKYNGDGWADSTQAYQQLGSMTSNRFLPRLRRRGYSFGKKWVAVVEAHRTGWPHVNIIMHDPDLAAELAVTFKAREAAGALGRERILVGGELLAQVTGAGWGRHSTAEVVRDGRAVADYLVKLAAKQDEHGDAESRARITGEVVKLSQIPEEAPWNTRRLRSGKGFLPPRRRDGTLTGGIVISGPTGSRRMLTAKAPKPLIDDDRITAWFDDLRPRPSPREYLDRWAKWWAHMDEVRTVMTATAVTRWTSRDAPPPKSTPFAEILSELVGLQRDGEWQRAHPPP